MARANVARRALPYVAAALLAACTGVLPPPPRGQDLLPWQQALQDLGPVVTASLPNEAGAFDFDEHTTVVITHDRGDDGDRGFGEGQRQGLRDFVQKGGRVLLLGHSASLAAAMGLEPEWPESSTFRWGFDRRATMGRARLGFEVVSGRSPELFEALQVAPEREHTFFVAGGEPCAVPLCAWSIGEPRRGEVLARLVAQRDGEVAPGSAPVLVHWRHGRGEVLALGLLPDVDNADPTVRANAVTFLRAAAQSLQGPTRGALVLLTVPHAEPAAPVAVRPAFARRDGPNLPLLAHWGWQVPLQDRDDGTLQSTDALVRDVLLPSWLAGADLFEIDVSDAQQQTPLAWPARDPLKRPAAWPTADRPLWNLADARRLAAEAHARGMLLLGAIAPLAAAERTTERLAAMRFLARELTDVRRLGQGAFDGLGVRDGWRDDGGHGLLMLQDFHPGAALYSTGERAAGFAGGLRALDADDGAVQGLGLAGLSATWRSGFAADTFPLGVLDARARRAAAVAVDAVAGGGSHGDWIVTQANDFVRARAGLGGSMWWRRFDPAAFDRETVAYVHGVSQEPLVAAVAMQLSATGSDGHRAAARALLEQAPVGFGAESPAPAAVHVLQNNWFRLAGSGGPLLFDAGGTARFRAGEAKVLATSFLRTRLFGARPDLDQRTIGTLDLLARGLAGAGGHARTVRAGAAESARLPAVLAFAEAPRWPAAVAVDWAASTGYHELDYQLRGVAGRGIVGISLDGELLTCVAWRSDQAPVQGAVPLHVTGDGPRTLQFEVLEGGAVAFDRLRIVRQGDVGAAARVLEPAGSLARLEERSQSSLHGERVELVAAADFPGFLLRIDWQSAARGLQVERSFQLAGYRVPGAADLRQPFVLAASDRELPDIVVVPLQLERHDRFSVDDGALVLHSAPGAGSQQRLGFLFVPRAVSAAVRDAATTMCRSLDQPTPLDLAATGEAVLHSDLSVPWTRIVHLDGAGTAPVLVQENGWWTWRGTQPAPDGGRWLRVRHEVGWAVRLVAGPSVLARTRPGPGSLHLLALQDPEPASVTVQVVQPSLLQPPSVVMGQDFDDVRLDGQPWACSDGRTVFLPDRVGTYRIECSTRGGGAGPGVRTTRAPLVHCSYVAERRALVLVTPPDAGRPFELPWTAVLRGPRPTRIQNGEIVAEGALPHRDAEAAAAAAAGGTLIRFRSGTTEIFYGQ